MSLRCPAVAAVLAAILVLPMAVAAQIRVAPEFVANTYTPDAQYNPAIAIDNAGTFVVVWQSYAQEAGYGAYGGVFGRRYAANGGALGAEFQVNTYTSDYQGYPSVAKHPGSGDFVVVWDSYQGLDWTEVFVQRFASSGAPQGGEVQVNAFTTGFQSDAAVARSATGEFVVVWGSRPVYISPYGYLNPQDGDYSGIFGRRYDANGVALDLEFQVNAYTTSDQMLPAVATDASGNFVVVWMSYGQDGENYGIFGQRFSSAGVPQGGEFQVNTYTSSYQGPPAVASDPSGNFVVVWETANDGSLASVAGRRFAASGTAIGAEFTVNTYTTGSQYAPQVSRNTDGFVVTWVSSGQDGSFSGVFGQQFAPNGIPFGPEFAVNTYVTGDQYGPAVALDATGRFVAAWSSPRPASSDDIAVQRFEFGGELDGKVLDFHANARADLLWYNRITGQVYLWSMNGGTPTAFNPITTVADLDWGIVAGGDFGGDGRADLVWYNRATGGVYLWQMNGAATISTVPIATVPDLNWQIQAVGDTDGDGRADLIWQNFTTGGVYVWKMNGASIVSTLPVAPVGDFNWRVVGSRDFNGDGRSDLLWRNRVSGQVYVWFLNGSTPTATVPVSTVGDMRWRIVAGGDFNGDGRSDIVWHHQSTGQTYLWTLSPSGALAGSFLISTVDANWRIIGSGDFDGNLRADLLWHNGTTGQAYVWLMNGSSIVSVHASGAVDANWLLQPLH
jgi:hypothetical protein